jgi:hypothetical protein
MTLQQYGRRVGYVAAPFTIYFIARWIFNDLNPWVGVFFGIACAIAYIYHIIKILQ